MSGKRVTEPDSQVTEEPKEPKEPKSSWTTDEIYSGLEARFAHPAWALVTEVRNATGLVTKERYADAMAMSLWPSRGLTLEGVEVKASRSDWTRELKNPAKADAISSYCDRWWVAVGHRDIVRAGELPDAWGLLAPGRTGKSLEVVREAPKNEKPRAIGRDFLASLFRAAAGIHERSNARARDEGVASGRQQVAYEWKQLNEAVAKFEEASGVKIREYGSYGAKNVGEVFKEIMAGNILTRMKHVDQFEAASGVKITEWDAGNVGEAVRLVMGGGSDGLQNALKSLRKELHRTVANIDGFFVAKESVKPNGVDS